MSASISLLNKAIIKPFYRQNAALFFFIFILMFGVIPAGQQLSYHYHLIMGMLTTRDFFLIVILIWILYAIKTYLFVTDCLQQPAYSFFNIYAGHSHKTTYRLLFYVQSILHAPVGVYSIIIASVAIYKGLFVQAVIVLLVNIFLCVLGAFYYQFLLFHPGQRMGIIQILNRLNIPSIRKPYFFYFLQYVLTDLKLIFLGCKVFTCCILYFLLKGLTATDYDLRMPYLVFSIGLFAHSVLFHKFRNMEETRLRFYRTLPVSLLKRFSQYALLCLFLLLPEIWMISRMAIEFLHAEDAVSFVLFGYGGLIFLLSLLHCTHFEWEEFLKIMLGLFTVFYFFVLGGAVRWISLFMMGMSFILFLKFYYKYETIAVQEDQ